MNEGRSQNSRDYMVLCSVWSVNTSCPCHEICSTVELERISCEVFIVDRSFDWEKWNVPDYHL